MYNLKSRIIIKDPGYLSSSSPSAVKRSLSPVFAIKHGRLLAETQKRLLPSFSVGILPAKELLNERPSKLSSKALQSLYTIAPGSKPLTKVYNKPKTTLKHLNMQSESLKAKSLLEELKNSTNYKNFHSSFHKDQPKRWFPKNIIREKPQESVGVIAFTNKKEDLSLIHI